MTSSRPFRPPQVSQGCSRLRPRLLVHPTSKMLSACAPARPFISVSRPRVSPVSVRRASMATAASSPVFTLVVKGDPETGTLLDCPFCHRVLLTLQNKNIPFGLEFVDLTKPRPQWLLDVNQGKVPVIKENDTMLPDSDKIVVMLEERFPSPSMKSDAPDGIGAKVFPAFRQFLQCKPEEADAKKQALLAELQPVNDYLSQQGKGPLFGGKTMDATDAAFAPKLYHIMVALPHFQGFEVPASMTALWRYIGYIQMLPAWQAVDYGSAKIVEGWSKHH